jgi:ubiquinone/menaquinone biosynthesis C-methylase UbiE
MSDTYDSEKAAASYDSARGLPETTMALWMSRLAEAVPRDLIQGIVDLGGGTGRFSSALQGTYDCEVVVVDPSESMLRAGFSARASAISRVCGTAEQLPLAVNSAGLVWISQAYHHFVDKRAAMREVHRILIPSGYLAIRNGTQESDAELEWTSCFPEAQALGKKKIPSLHELTETVSECGFRVELISRVRQLFAASWQEHFDKISKRGLSGLLEISDQAFEQGLVRFKTWIQDKPHDQPVFEPVDLLVFRKVATR